MGTRQRGPFHVAKRSLFSLPFPLMGPEALSEGGIDTGRPRGLIEKVSSASGPPSVRG